MQACKEQACKLQACKLARTEGVGAGYNDSGDYWALVGSGERGEGGEGVVGLGVVGVLGVLGGCCLGGGDGGASEFWDPPGQGTRCEQRAKKPTGGRWTDWELRQKSLDSAKGRHEH